EAVAQVLLLLLKVFLPAQLLWLHLQLALIWLKHWHRGLLVLVHLP
ncbi:hypothetical protein CCACVL1_01058, partial [Corchorus capsularis]